MGKQIPFIKVFEIPSRDGRMNVYISFLGTHHHYSLHEAKIVSQSIELFTLRQDNQIVEYPKHYAGKAPIQFTSFDVDKTTSTWDVERMQIAKSLFLTDPEKHIKYYENRILPLGTFDPFPLGSRTVVLSERFSKKRYPKDKCCYLKNNLDRFVIDSVISTENLQHNSGVTVQTSLGWILFQISAEPS